MLPGETQFCATTLNNLELQHDLVKGRERGAERQTETVRDGDMT